MAGFHRSRSCCLVSRQFFGGLSGAIPQNRLDQDTLLIVLMEDSLVTFHQVADQDISLTILKGDTLALFLGLA